MRTGKGFLILVGLLLAALIVRAIGGRPRRLTRRGMFFGSFVKVDVCYGRGGRDRAEAALDEVWDRFADIHHRLGVYDEDSDINRINAAAGGEAVLVPQDTFHLIREAVNYHRLSHGAFDVTLGPLIDLWKRAEAAGRLPSPSEIEAARALADIAAVEWTSDGRVRLRRRGVRINLDGIGDGYAADEAARILRSRGFHDFLVDASGELYAGGKSCRGRPWRIGVKDPAAPSRMIDVLELTDMAVSTSGIYEQGRVIDGRRYSHIIDPRTGEPTDAVVSATAVAPSALFADFISTALCVLPAEEGIGWVEGLRPPTAAMVVDRHGVRRESRGYGAFRAGR